MTEVTTPVASGTDIVKLAIAWRNAYNALEADTKLYPVAVVDQMEAEARALFDAFTAALDTRHEVIKR